MAQNWNDWITSLYDAMYRRLYRVAYRLTGNRETAKELTQDTFLWAQLHKEELAPTWFPEGFAAGEPEVWDNEVSRAVQLTFTDSEGKNFAVSIDCYKNEESLGGLAFEKDAGDVELYTSKDRTFYIMSNVNIMAAIWSDYDLVETIRGDLSVDEIKKMIDSMGMKV